jgi:hypothetical protein|tara:strand:- start:7547 stop:7747 length:201 start_codon:yes stop_codon:yes gene_type:complete
MVKKDLNPKERLELIEQTYSRYVQGYINRKDAANILKETNASNYESRLIGLDSYRNRDVEKPCDTE